MTMTTTTNGHATGQPADGIAGSSHAFHIRPTNAYELGWRHARSMLVAQFAATLENARRMAVSGPEREFHAGLAAGLERMVTALDATPAERVISVVGLEDDNHEFSGIAACTTIEQALAWVRFLNTLPTGDAEPVIGPVRLDPPIPALGRTEQIYTAHIKHGADPGAFISVTVSEVGDFWHGESLWHAIREVGNTYYVTGIFAEDKAGAEEQATEAVRAWLAAREESEKPR